MCRHSGHRPLQCVQLVPGEVASVLLGAFAAGFCSDTRSWRGLRGDWRRFACAGAPDVFMVASGARGDVEAIDFSLLYDATSLRGGAALRSGESVWGGQDRRDLPGDFEAARGVVDLRAGRRRRTDEQ